VPSLKNQLSCLGLALLSLILFSCGNETKPAISVNEKQMQDKKELLRIIEGGWVNEEYIQALKKYQSPMAAASYGLPVPQMAYDISKLEGDTLVNLLGRFHHPEADRFKLVFYSIGNGKMGMRTFELPNDPSRFVLNYQIDLVDTTLELIGDSIHAQYNRVFRQFPQRDGIILTATELCVNQELFAGKWLLNGDTVVLTEYGQISNMKRYSRYSIATSSEYPKSNPDEISFYNDSAGVNYAWILKGKDLELYEMERNRYRLTLNRGRLVYTMRKLD
jgi:hypothetical protein